MELWKNESYKKTFQINTLIATLLTILVTVAAFINPSVYNIYNSYMLSQAKGQDLVTLLIIIPVMLYVLRGAFHNKPVETLILAGGVGYLLYTYITFSYLGYCRLLLLYIIIYSTSLAAVIAALGGLRVTPVMQMFQNRKINHITAYYNIIIASLILLLWLKDMVGTLITGEHPAGVISNNGASVIYANDTGFLLPAIMLSGILLLKNKAWGYLLTAVLLVKEVSMGAAILGMVAFMYFDGQPGDIVMSIIFGIITISSLIISYLFFTKRNN